MPLVVSPHGVVDLERVRPGTPRNSPPLVVSCRDNSGGPGYLAGSGLGRS